jgi:excinuclease ABC subunit A
MTAGSIQIRGARQNNLAGIDVDIPRNRLVAITGVSGSGKSSLAFDTLFREGQRRFLETLSAYARQFLGRMEKPAVESIDGLSPAIAVDQQPLARGPRSTVGTITEVSDFLRVLFARAGTARCPEHLVALRGQTAEAILQQVQDEFGDQALQVLAPLVRDRKGHHAPRFADLRKKGFVRARVDGELRRLEELGPLARYRRHTIEVVVDRLKGAALPRLREAIGAALELAHGEVVILAASQERAYSTSRACPHCGTEAPPLEPRSFSFNSPHGWCTSCQGLGVLRRASARVVVADAALSIRAGALAVTRANGSGLNLPRVSFAFLEHVARAHGFDLDTPWKKLPPQHKRVILHGSGAARFEDRQSWKGQKHAGSFAWQRRYAGVLPAIEKALGGGLQKRIAQRFVDTIACPACQGSRLNRFASVVDLGGATLGQLARSAIADLPAALAGLRLGTREATIAAGLLQEIYRRLGFLEQVGLSYLTLDRAADSLSSGEAQRIRLAAQLGAGLEGVLYVLDEPSIGLHARDHGRLLAALAALRDAGNTVVVVEHDEGTLRSADWLIEIGPGPGRHGGRVVSAGTPRELARSDTPTGELLRGELAMPAPTQRRTGDGRSLRLRGARGFHLKDVDVAFPLGTLTVVTGVSGSGKSTLVHHTLERAVARHLGREAPPPEDHDGLDGLVHVEDLVFVDSAPIGRTPRSNPATYSGVGSLVRDLFASLPEARMRGWPSGRFSFNVPGGRCEACQGAGATLVELQFLAPVTVPCEECGGHRFQAETLAVRYAEKSIADVLALTVEEAAELFRDHPKITRALAALIDVGLGYLALGQPSTTVSGGEAQRLKLATELQKRASRHTLYLLDEPTTGLHPKDVQRLLATLQRLVDAGHTVIVIEHNLDVIRAADHVIDLGPEGGQAGGRVLVVGTPEEVEAARTSHTGAALRAGRSARAGVLRGTSHTGLAPAALGAARLEVVDARTHNLQGVSVSLPKHGLIVVTGPSGSGKSSLALDTIHAAGRQRFVESLPTYARQFLSSNDRPPVERISGLGPSVAVEARTSLAHPRSTVATTTEIHDHLRVLWARAGTPRCPVHGEELRSSDAGRLAKRVLREHAGAKAWIVAPIFGPTRPAVDDLARAFGEANAAWRKSGFARALVDESELRLTNDAALPQGARVVDLVVDRLALLPGERARIAEAIESAAVLAGGRLSVVLQGGARAEYGTRGACTRCGFALEAAFEPRHFSFNTHVGACPDCDGLGERWSAVAEKLVDRPALPLVSADGGPTAVGGKLGRYLTKGKGYYEHLLRAVARAHRIDLGRPFDALSESARELLLHGRGAQETYTVQVDQEYATFELHDSFRAPWPGLCGHVDAWHAKSEDPAWRAILEGCMERVVCSSCAGERLAPGPRAVTLGERRLPEVLRLGVDQALRWLDQLELGPAARRAVGPVLAELRSRVELLARVGLGYVTLERTMSTLSGGEARRVRLSAALGSRLVGVCYVLDEPTVGLHPTDVDRLTDALCDLRDLGNTVIVVEHDERALRRADWLVDMGPASGRAGGRVVASGPPAEVARHPTSLTARALRGELEMPRRTSARDASESLTLAGARLHNLRGVELTARFGEITGVCGPSGSGKSTLVLDCLVPALRGERAQGRWTSLSGAQEKRLIVVDASPIGRTPASVPATAMGLMDPLRELFARTTEARAKGLRPAHFGFNSPHGRCPACEGKGATLVEMQFLADLWIPCEECRGSRYRPEVLEVRYRGASVADVLALSVDEAARFFQHVPALAGPLQTRCAVGLGYLTLCQSSTTLSAGEAQRIKLAAELTHSADVARSVIVLDEPSTGLAKSDLAQLFAVLVRLAERGDALIVIEHQVDLLAACDRLIELGPAGGEAGGQCIACGTPAELARDPASVTGPYLARVLGLEPRATPRAAPAPGRRRSAKAAS